MKKRTFRINATEQEYVDLILGLEARIRDFETRWEASAPYMKTYLKKAITRVKRLHAALLPR